VAVPFVLKAVRGNGNVSKKKSGSTEKPLSGPRPASAPSDSPGILDTVLTPMPTNGSLDFVLSKDSEWSAFAIVAR